MSKARVKTSTKCCSVRIKSDSKKAAKALLEKANKKDFGRTVKFDELFDLAIGLINSEHIELLQRRSMTNEDRKENLRQKYVALKGPISKDEFTGFMMTPQFQDFLRQQENLKSVA
jgi:hypothetical protein